VYATLKEKIAAETAAQKVKYAAYEALFAKAHAAGMAAGEACQPTPMMVSEANYLTGKPEGQSWYVPEGACGFAWVKVRPGNKGFGHWLNKTGKARASYQGGVQVRVGQFGQSIARKEAYASAFAEVLQAAGVTGLRRLSAGLTRCANLRTYPTQGAA
jgi:hypothetical protein